MGTDRVKFKQTGTGVSSDRIALILKVKSLGLVTDDEGIAFGQNVSKYLSFDNVQHPRRR